MNEVFLKLLDAHKRVDAARKAVSARQSAPANGRGKPAVPAQPSAVLTQALADRGILQTDLGLASAGVKDLLVAYFHEKEPSTALRESATLERLLEEYWAETENQGKDDAAKRFSYSWLEARLGEALRVYARDILLSERVVEDPEPLRRTIVASIGCFTRALVGARSEHEPWIRAHLAAALTMQYWTRLAAGEAPERCADTALQAEAEFIAALPGYDPRQPWCKRFYAFLLALRGDDGDFSKATKLLEECHGAVPYHDSTIDRHQAMLFSYDTLSDNRETARRAALASLDKGLLAVKADSEDYIASHFSTYSLYSLAYVCPPANDQEQEEAEMFKRALPGAIEAARVRSTNTISQAYATLTELALLKALSTPADDDLGFNAAVDDAISALKELETRADLETRCMFIRSMVWQVIHDTDTKISDTRRGRLQALKSYYDRIRTPMLAIEKASTLKEDNAPFN